MQTENCASTLSVEINITVVINFDQTLLITVGDLVGITWRFSA